MEKTLENLDSLNTKMATIFQSILNSCINPEKAVIALHVELAPIREVLNEYYRYYDVPNAPSESKDDIIVMES